VEIILAFSAVGSLREEIAPGDFIIPNSIIDRTKGIRPSSYFEGMGIVAHAMFGDCFDTGAVKLIGPLVKKVLDEHPEGAVKLHEGKTVVCMEGPQFSTRAESEMYRQWGVSIRLRAVIGPL
jgi:5'-methylthioadenosine phosphorylase